MKLDVVCPSLRVPHRPLADPKDETGFGGRLGSGKVGGRQEIDYLTDACEPGCELDPGRLEDPTCARGGDAPEPAF